MSTLAAHELVATVAALISAIGGCAAAVAAFRSAASAREAVSIAQASELRAARRQVSLLANEVQLEALITSARVRSMDYEYTRSERKSTPEALPSLGALRKNTERFSALADGMAAHAEKFGDGAAALQSVPVDEVERVLNRLSENLSTLKTIRAELERNYAELLQWNEKH